MPIITPDEFFSWAVSTVMTRQNLIPSPDGSRMIHALIPMWDMCNHENGRVSHGDNEPGARTSNAFSVITIDYDGLQRDLGSLRVLRAKGLQEGRAGVHKLWSEDELRLLRALRLRLHG